MSTVFVGIDTGGTFTDAVVYDRPYDDDGRLLGAAKAPTTHADLTAGITAALDGALADAGVTGGDVAMVALSTTLATNALVEGMGRPAGLVLIGFEQAVLDRGGLRSALGADPVILVAGGHTTHGTEQARFDGAALAAALDSIDRPVEGFAVTGQFAVRNPDHEIAARDLIRARTGLPVTCSHELSDALDGPRRSITALLNARLIGLIDALVTTTRAALTARGVTAPIMVMRGTAPWCRMPSCGNARSRRSCRDRRRVWWVRRIWWCRGRRRRRHRWNDQRHRGDPRRGARLQRPGCRRRRSSHDGRGRAHPHPRHRRRQRGGGPGRSHRWRRSRAVVGRGRAASGRADRGCGGCVGTRATRDHRRAAPPGATGDRRRGMGGILRAGGRWVDFDDERPGGAPNARRRRRRDPGRGRVRVRQP
ncbi:MAG: hydantoinase/oxoprolinase N-terminal domain-containing protein [Acidimicrobiales bacterium]